MMGVSEYRRGAELIRLARVDEQTRIEIARVFVLLFEESNPGFSRDYFLKACGLSQEKLDGKQ